MFYELFFFTFFHRDFTNLDIKLNQHNRNMDNFISFVWLYIHKFAFTTFVHVIDMMFVLSRICACSTNLTD